jgi:tetratricopeptide (TPR) repeat protein
VRPSPVPALLASACALLLALGGPLSAADAPTADEWTPVEAALNAGDAAAPAKLAALVAAHPQWADGLRTLAQVQLRQGDRANAAANARKALALAPADASAAAVAVQALAGNGQTAEAYAIADRFTGAQDPQGWVNFYAAAAALEADDRKKAGLYLALAMGRTKTPPAEFSFLDARISEQAGDLPRAEAGLQRTVAANPRLWDAWYQLGVVQYRLADQGPGDRSDWLAKAEANFLKVTANVPKEALGWLGLGRAQLTLGQILLITNEDDGKAKAREAVRSLRNALELRSDLRDAYLNLGVALLIGGNHQEAITQLLKARELGVTDRNLGFNLMLAYQQAGKTAEFEAEAQNVQATSVGERITLGMGFFKSGSFALAIQLLESALPGVADDRERSGQVHRFIGHAHAALAERARKHLAAGTDVPGPPSAEVERELDAARDAWRKAGSFGDHTAQRFFMAQEAARSPLNGYEAGWQRLAWHSYLSLDGWMLVAGNYGGAITGGQGLAGMWARHPVHAGIWGALIGMPLLLAILGFCRRPPPPVHPSREREQARSDSSSSGIRQPAPAPVQRGRAATVVPPAKPAASKPAPPRQPTPVRDELTPAPSPIAKPKGVQRTPANPGKNETEPVARSAEKNLTEPVANPGAKSVVKTPVRDQRRTTTEDSGVPLEKRKPKGGDDSALERKPGR